MITNQHAVVDIAQRDEAYLSTSHQVSACGNDRGRILLDGSGSSVTSVADVLEEHRIQRWVRKLSNRLWHTSTSGLDGNVVVLLEIDTSVLLGGVILLAEELLLHAHVTAAGDVLALLPSTITEGLTGATVAAARSSSAVQPSTPSPKQRRASVIGFAP